MLSDAPHYVRRRVKTEDIDDKDAQNEANKIVSFYQSNLQQ